MFRYLAAIGMFDGVHRGHRHLFETVCDEASRRGLSPAAVTFTNHPSALLHPEKKVKQLTSTDEKIQLIQNLGLKAIAMDFTPELSKLTSADFIRLLHDKYAVDCLVVGFNNKFGSDRCSTIEDYRRFGAEIGVDVVEATEVEDMKVSSSLIRQMIEEGRVEDASRALGRDYTLTGRVVRGQQIGRRLGFPTANISPTNPFASVPGNGVYAAYVNISTNPDVKYKAMVNIGSRPTVNSDGNVTIEVHLLDFKGNLYGQTLTVEFHNRIRDERRFSSLSELTAAVATDAAVTRRILTES